MMAFDVFSLADSLQMTLEVHPKRIEGAAPRTVQLDELDIRCDYKIVSSWCEGEGIVLVHVIGDVGLMVGIAPRSAVTRAVVVDLSRLKKRGDKLLNTVKPIIWEHALAAVQAGVVAGFERKGRGIWTTSAPAAAAL